MLAVVFAASAVGQTCFVVEVSTLYFLLVASFQVAEYT